MKIVSAIEDNIAIHKILTRLGLLHIHQAVPHLQQSQLCEKQFPIILYFLFLHKGSVLKP